MKIRIIFLIFCKSQNYSAPWNSEKFWSYFNITISKNDVFELWYTFETRLDTIRPDLSRSIPNVLDIFGFSHTSKAKQQLIYPEDKVII